MTSDPVILTEGDNNALWTFTVKRDGAPVNISLATLLLFVRDDDAPEGTNIVNGVAPTVTDGPNGVCTFNFTSAHTAIAAPNRVVKGRWNLKVNGVWSEDGEFRINKSGFTA